MTQKEAVGHGETELVFVYYALILLFSCDYLEQLIVKADRPCIGNIH